MAHKNRWTVFPDPKSDSFIISFSYRDQHGVSRRYRKSAGRRVSRRDAEAKARALYMELEKDPHAFVERFVAQPETKAKALPFADVAATFIEDHVSTLRPSTRRTHEQVLRVHLVPVFGDLDLRDIGKGDVGSYKAQKLRERQSPKSVRNQLSVLSAIYEFAKDREWVADNPAKGIKLKVPRRGPQWLDDTAGERFLAAVREHDPEYTDLFLLALRTGMRQGEILGLRFRDVYFDVGETGIIVVSSSLFGGELGPTKSGKERVVPLHPEVRDALLRRRGSPDAFVFTRGDGSPLTGNIVKNPMHRAAKAVEMEHLRFHDLRHSFASQLVAAGESPNHVQQLLGHSDLTTTMRYSHVHNSALARAVLKLGPARHGHPPAPPQPSL